jgi:quinol monooxygenase YgiN
MMAFIARLVVKPEKEAEFVRLQRELSDLTHAHEPDTYSYDVIRHREQPHTYVVYSSFKDEAAFQLHMQTPAHERLVPPILACLAQDMDLQFFDGV